MMDISKAAALSQIYTNHFVRATAITLWSDAQISSRHMMNISGHNEENTTTRAIVESTYPVFGCLVHGVFLARSFKPIVTGWIACPVLQNHSKCRLFLQQVS